MNRNLNEAIFGIGKVDALMSAIESCCLDIEVAPEERGKSELLGYLFYVLWDEIKKLSGDLERLCEDCQIVDVIYAANESRRKAP